MNLPDMSDANGRKLGSIALARQLCYQINGAADDSDDMDGGGYGSVDIAEILSAEVVRLQKALAQPVQEPVEVDQATMELAESVGLIGPTSRTHDLHQAIQRFHDLICVNATVKAAQMAVDVIRESTPPKRPWAGLTDEDWEKVVNRKNTVLDTFEQGATWAAYKLERRNT